MSVVTVKKYNDKVVMACDSQITTGNIKNDVMGIHKIIKTNDMLVGGVGALNVILLLQEFVSKVRPTDTSFASILAFCLGFKDYVNDTIGINDADPMTTHASFVLVFGDKAFWVTDYVPLEIVNYVAIGSGAEVSLGILHFGGTPEDAVRVACDLSHGVGGAVEVYEIDMTDKYDPSNVVIEEEAETDVSEA